VLLFLGQLHPEITNDKMPKLFNEPNVRRSVVRMNDAEYNLLTQNAMFTFLSYTKVSTSGAMFHSLSNGTPVLAPAIGTIPCYVRNGVEGWIYNSNQRDGILSCIERAVLVAENEVQSLKIRSNCEGVVKRLGWMPLLNRILV